MASGSIPVDRSLHFFLPICKRWISNCKQDQAWLARMDYDLYHFNDVIEDEFKCQSCCKVLEDAVESTNCEHTFCSKCLIGSLFVVDTYDARLTISELYGMGLFKHESANIMSELNASLIHRLPQDSKFIKSESRIKYISNGQIVFSFALYIKLRYLW